MMTMSETSLVYDCEHVLCAMLTEANREGGTKTVKMYGSVFVMPVERKFASVETIELYISRVLALPEVVEAYPGRAKAPIRVRPRRGDTKAHYEYGVIAIPMGLGSWALREEVVLHELAHHLALGHNHDRDFRKALVLLLRVCMSPEVSHVLQMLWYEGGLE